MTVKNCKEKSHLVLIGILILFSYFMLMFGNNSVSLTHPDEVFYIQSAKEMVKYQRWFTPMIFDKVQFEKPFVAFALFAAAIKYLGLNSGAARLFPALFGIIGVIITYWISWIMFGKKRTAFLAGVMLTTSFIYMALSRAVLTDMIFSVMVAANIGFFYLAVSRPQYRNRGMFWGFIIAGIAVLTKGLLGICFPLATLILYSVYKRNFTVFLSKGSIIGFCLFIIIIMPWHIAMYIQNGHWFIQEYFQNVHIRRLFEAEHKRLDNWYFYLAIMFAGVMPWSLFWAPAVNTSFKKIKEKSDVRDAHVYIFAWIISVYIFVQFASSKLASYIFPLVPAIILLLSYTIGEHLDTQKQGGKVRSFTVIGYLMSFLLFIGIFIGLYYADRHIAIITSLGPVYITAGCIFMISVLLFAFNRMKWYKQLIFTLCGISMTLLLMLFMAKPYIEPWVSCKDICDVLKTIDQSESTVIASKFYVRGIRYYTDRDMAVIDINGKGFWSEHPIPFLNTDQMVLDLLYSQNITYAVVKEGNVKDLKRIVSNQNFTLEDLGGIGGKFILRITRLPKQPAK